MLTPEKKEIIPAPARIISVWLLSLLLALASWHLVSSATTHSATDYDATAQLDAAPAVPDSASREDILLVGRHASHSGPPIRCRALPHTTCRKKKQLAEQSDQPPPLRLLQACGCVGVSLYPPAAGREPRSADERKRADRRFCGCVPSPIPICSLSRPTLGCCAPRHDDEPWVALFF